MERACKEAKKGNMDLKQSVQHIGNVFLNAVETGKKEAAFMLLQLNMTYMSWEGIFLNTSPPDKRTFLIKDKRTLESMDPESTEIQANNIINHYKNHPNIFENFV